MDVVVWLRSVGLGKYEATFRENEIDETVLPNLTAEDLKDLGVDIVGHRRKILDAIAALRADTNASPTATPGPAALDASPRDTAERRQVTVMFSDLVGSTALSARMDPEDLREVISAYQKCVAETVQRLGGFVAKYMGDGALVYFGYPHAHEDDAERAVRAGLELVAAITALKSSVPLQTRIGIATGLVVVGDLIGSGAAQEQAIVGQTPNLAARLQSLAEPNSVVIAEGTRKLLGNVFELEDLGAQDLKGIGGPVRAWAALRASSAEGRFEALHAGGLTALVGREEELELLFRRWSRAKTGEGQVVLLSGEAGIGKSRLTAALLERLAAERHTRLRYFCSPQHTDSAQYPIISQMERAAGFAHDDTAQAKCEKLDALLAQTSTPRQDAALLAEMLSLPNDGRYPTLELAPQQRRQRTLEALTAQLEALSRSNPVLMIFEDVHWIDPTSLEALGRAVDRIRTLDVLLIVTYRPEFEPPWIGRPHVTALTINRLAEREIAAVIDRLTGNKPFPASIRQDIIERTDGIPLFVEEMTKAVIEAKGESETIGVGLLFRQGAPPHATYLFKHALVRDAAYGTLLREPRRALHARIAETLESKFTEQAENQPELLARHCTEAGLIEKAAGLWGRAGQRWLARSALVEGIEQITRGLSQITALPSATPALRREEIELQVALITPLIHVKGQAAPETRLAAERARLLIEKAETLGEPPEDPLLLFSVLSSFWSGNYVAFNGDAMRELAAQFLALAEKQGATVPLMIGHRLMGCSLLLTGHLAEGRAHLDQALARYDPTEHRLLAARFGQDIRVAILCYWSWALCLLGYPNAAIADSNQALKDAREIGQAATLMYALLHALTFHVLCRNYATAGALADELIGLAEDKSASFWRAIAIMHQGCVSIAVGKAADAVQMITFGIAALRSTGATVRIPHFLSYLAAAYAQLGQLNDAWRCVNEAMTTVETMGERWYVADIYRIAGEIALKSPERDATKAETYFQRALAVAYQQQAKSWELRAAMSMARLWRVQGKPQQARELLAPVYGWFTEGFDTLDLKEARALLDELHA